MNRTQRNARSARKTKLSVEKSSRIAHSSRHSSTISSLSLRSSPSSASFTAPSRGGWSRSITSNGAHSTRRPSLAARSATVSTRNLSTIGRGDEPDRSHLTKLKPQANSIEQLKLEDQYYSRVNQRDIELDKKYEELQAKREAEAAKAALAPPSPNVLQKVLMKFGMSDGFLKEKDAKATKFVSDKIGGSDLQHVRDMKRAADLPPPPTHLTRHTSSPYFLSMWDPELRNPDFEKAFTSASRLRLADMDLIGHDFAGQPVNLRERFTTPNKISLVQVVSTQMPLHNATVVSNIWNNSFQNHGRSNQDGAILTESTIINISQGLVASLFKDKLNESLKTTYQSTDIINFLIKRDNDPIARARRALDCRNRFVTNIFLVDERGLIRWRSAIGSKPTPEFLEVLNQVTQDLIMETQYNEAD